jgi:hypothetical protein
MNSATPVPPEKRLTPNCERMQQDAHLARLVRVVALPLTLLAERAGTTTANAGRIHHAQTAIGFSALLLSSQRASRWTPERPIGLERKVGSSEATHFEGGSGSRGAVPRSRGRWVRTRGSLGVLFRESSSEFGDA